MAEFWIEPSAPHMAPWINGSGRLLESDGPRLIELLNQAAPAATPVNVHLGGVDDVEENGIRALREACESRPGYLHVWVRPEVAEMLRAQGAREVICLDLMETSEW